MTVRGLYWFTNDLRLEDNPALSYAASSVDELILVYVQPRWASMESSPLDIAVGQHRKRFHQQCVDDLASQLSGLDQHLLVATEPAITALADWLAQLEPDVVFGSVHAGWNERLQRQALAEMFGHIRFEQIHSHTIFDPICFPFEVSSNDLPASFSAFRRRVESIDVPAPLQAVSALPAAPKTRLCNAWVSPGEITDSTGEKIVGGPRAGQRHLKKYFSGDLASQYKQVRNALDGWDNSTKFSAWLAAGCISPRQVIAQLKTYESRAGASESSYWIYFELLWREYFQWYAHAHGKRLFLRTGVQEKDPGTSNDPAIVASWCDGQTDYPIVNACMNQLRSTGFMSNRGRQLVASCLVNELAQDWAPGATWFEHHLIDYDVASNWGNWQYVAGVGADPRGKRRFDLDWQARQYDPTGDFVRRWT